MSDWEDDIQSALSSAIHGEPEEDAKERLEAAEESTVYPGDKTLRDEFAMAALRGCQDLGYRVVEKTGEAHHAYDYNIAAMAYCFADAMLKARDD